MKELVKTFHLALLILTFILKLRFSANTSIANIFWVHFRFDTWNVYLESTAIIVIGIHGGIMMVLKDLSRRSSSYLVSCNDMFTMDGHCLTKQMTDVDTVNKLYLKIWHVHTPYRQLP